MSCQPPTPVTKFATSGPDFEDQGGKGTLSFVASLSGEGAVMVSGEAACPAPWRAFAGSLEWALGRR